MDVRLFVVDPQNDFCSPKGSLYVNGADQDMSRLSQMIQRLDRKLTDIVVTLDSHHKVDISHGIWWKQVSDGSQPAPFTILGLDSEGRIRACDPANGMAPSGAEYTTRIPSFLPRSKAYLKALADGGKFPHCIWPDHCLIGSEGHNVYPELWQAMLQWEEKNFGAVVYVTKGSNMWTEHFSGVKAEVPDPEDPTTHINSGLIMSLEEADMIVFAGEAKSHCVRHTVMDICDAFSDPAYLRKVTFLEDASSNVTGFDSFGDDFLSDMVTKGMNVETTDSFLA